MTERGVSIEELVARDPEAVRYLMTKGIQAVACGGPVWGTLEDLARQQGYTDDQSDTIVAQLSDLLAGTLNK
jgi:hypothetical protein